MLLARVKIISLAGSNYLGYAGKPMEIGGI